MREPHSRQEYVALHLATQHAEASGMGYPAVVHWSCEHWSEFMDMAGDPAVTDPIEREWEEMERDFEAFCTLAEIVAGPPPLANASMAEQLAWGERVQNEMDEMAAKLPAADDD